MSPKETVSALYAAYASGEAQRITALLHEDVIWVAPPGNATQVAAGLGKSGDAGAPAGSNNLDRDFIVRFMTQIYPRLFLQRKGEFRTIVAEGPIVFTEHTLSAVLPNGRKYVNDYCFAYEVRDGKVLHIREYMDTRGGWAQVFGDQEALPLLDMGQG